MSDTEPSLLSCFIYVHFRQEVKLADVYDWHDLALLLLEYAPNIDAYTRYVCIGTQASWQETFGLSEEAVCYITGFGISEFYDLSNRRSLTKIECMNKF